jgi:hypothetical protein
MRYGGGLGMMAVKMVTGSARTAPRPAIVASQPSAQIG